MLQPLVQLEKKTLNERVLNSQTQIYKKEIEVNRIIPRFKEASYNKKVLAFFLDMSILLFNFFLILMVFQESELFKLDYLSNSFIFSPFVVSLFILLSLFYFCLFEKNQTFGKLFFKIRLIEESGNKPSFNTIFVRAILVLISYFAFCLPLVLNFQDILTDTKVIEE